MNPSIPSDCRLEAARQERLAMEAECRHDRKAMETHRREAMRLDARAVELEEARQRQHIEG